MKFSELKPNQKLAYKFSKRLGENPPEYTDKSEAAFSTLLKRFSYDRLSTAIDFVFTDKFWVTRTFSLDNFVKNIDSVMKQIIAQERIQKVTGTPVVGLLPKYCTHALKHRGARECALCHVSVGLPFQEGHVCACPQTGVKSENPSLTAKIT